MTLRIQCLTIDAHDPHALAAWWREALGFEERPMDDEDEDEAAIVPPDGNRERQPALLFIRVPEGKTVKNRLHLDLEPADRDAEVARLEGLGATRVDIGQSGDESWVVLADPEGNEFCVLREKAG